MINTIYNNKNTHKQLLLILVFIISTISGCAFTKHENLYPKQSAEELLMLSYITPSKAEKIQIRAHLARQFPDSVEGMYSKTYLEYLNDRRDLELQYLEAMMNKYPDNINTLHYQAFEFGFDKQVATVKRALKIEPSFLNYNFIAKLADVYVDNNKADQIQELFNLIDSYEASLGSELYIFDYARGLAHKGLSQNSELALKFFESAMTKKGAIKNDLLLDHYFNAKYPEGLEGETAQDYLEEFEVFQTKLDALSATDLEKRIISHKLVKNIMAEKLSQNESQYEDTFYINANEHYFTSEVVTEMRRILIEQNQEGELLNYLQYAVKKLPNNPDTLGLLAAEYAYLGEYEQAEIYYQRALKNSYVLNDKKAYVRAYANDVLAPTYRSDEAIELLQDLKDSYPSKALSFNGNLSAANAIAGNYAEAKVYFDAYKASWKRPEADFPVRLESIINSYAERELEIKGIVADKQEETSVPKIVATSSVFTDWLIMSPDGKHFVANNGGSVYALWDVNTFSVVDRFENAILDDDYVKYMTKPVFSPDGRYLAYASEYKDELGSVMLIYDTQKHRFSHQLPMSRKTSGMAWSPDGEELVIWNYNRLIKYNLDDEAVVQQSQVKAQHGADIMLWTANGKYLALLERSSEGSIRIFDAETLQQLQKFDQVNWPHALGMSADGRYIFSADVRSTLHRWDTKKEFAYESIKIPVLGRIITAHPTKPQIIINDDNLGKNKLTLIDYEKMEVLETQNTGDNELNISYIDNGNKIFAATIEDIYHESYDSYEIYDATTLKMIDKYSGESAVVTGGAYANASRNQLVTWDKDGLHVWSVTTGEKLHSWPGEFKNIMLDPDNSDVIYGLESDPIEQVTYVGEYNLSNFSNSEATKFDFIVDKWSMGSGKLILSGGSYMQMDIGFVNGIVLACDLTTKMCTSMLVEMVTDELKYDLLGDSRFTEIAISPDQKYIALSTAWEDGWKQGETLSEVTRVFDFELGKLVQTFEHVGQLVFKDNETLAIEGVGGLYNKSTTYSIKSGKEVGVLGEDYVASTIASHDSWADKVSFPERNLSVKVSKDNRIEFYNAKDDELALTILAKRDDNWIAFLPTGEFLAAENGVDKIYWELAGKKLPMSEAIKKYKRDDLIETKLQAISEQL